MGGMVMSSENELLRDCLRVLMRYVGEAQCHGLKCRLPHCDSCFPEEQADAEDAKRIDIMKTARALLETRSEEPPKEEPKKPSGPPLRPCVRCQTPFEAKDWKDVVCPRCKDPFGDLFGSMFGGGPGR